MRTLERIGAPALVFLLAGLSACRPSSGTVALRFPNEAARRATVRLLVEAYDPEVGLASVGDRSCAEFLGRAADAQPLSGVPERRFYECAPDADGRCSPGWFESEPALEIPGGRSLIYVLAFASREPNATPFLEGCTDRFDTGGSGDGSEAVPVDLGLVLPRSARLVLAGSSRIVGAPGITSESALRVRVEAEEPQAADVTYGVPGVPIRFTPSGGATLFGAEGGGAVEIATDARGEAELRVTLPAAAGVGFVEASSEAVRVATETPTRPARSSVRFVVSAVEARSFRAASAQLADIGTPVAVAVGALEPGGAPIAAIAGCAGTPESCRVSDPGDTPGEARLAALTDLAGTPRALSVDRGSRAIVPADVVIAPLLPGGGAQIGLLAGRRAACADRVCTDPARCPCWTEQSGTPCPCEGAELRVFEARGPDAIAPRAALSLTASNAVALVDYAHPAQAPARLAVIGQGRTRNERPCATADRCLRSDLPSCRSDPASCGCPPEELCACPGCATQQRTGVCVANDKMVDMVALGPGDALTPHLGCSTREVACNNADPASTMGSCGGRGMQACTADSECGAEPCVADNRCACGSGTRCSAVDACGCRIPPRVWVGERDSNAFPYDVAAGRFGSTSGDDLVIAADGGLVFFSRTGESFALESSPLVNAPITRVATLSLDPLAEADRDRPTVDDVVWIAPDACLSGVSFQTACPIVRETEDAAGCFGVYASDGAETFFDLDGACRRFELASKPTALCTGDFDGNGAQDAAVSVEEGRELLLFLGDGWGGVSFPPQTVPLPAGATGGPLACADVDGDGITDIVVADPAGNVSILRSGT